MKKFLTFTDKLVKKQTRILCGISGGQDSIVTFFVLLHAKKKKFFNLELLYCQHFWQTKNFFSTVFIFNLGFLFEIPYNIVLPQNFLLTENRSRAWRKKIFFRVARLENMLNVVTGQTLTDKLEIFFNNLFRGVAPKGLSESNLLNYQKIDSSFFASLILKPKFFTSQVSLTIKYGQKKRIFGPKNEQSYGKQRCLLIFWKGKQENKNFYNTNFQKIRLVQKMSNLGPKKEFFGEENKGVCSFFEKGPTQIKRNRLKKSFHFSNTRRIKTGKNLEFQCFSVTKITTQTQITHKNLDYLRGNPLFSYSFCLYSRTSAIEIIYEKPLLEKARFTISKLVKVYDFPIITDVTNFSTNFSRNKIRYNFFPLIRYIFHAKFEFLIKNFLETLELEQKSLGNEVLGISFLLKTKKVIKPQNLNLKIDNVGKKKMEDHFFFKKNKIKTASLFPFPKPGFGSNSTKKNLLSQQRSLIRKKFFEYTDLELTYFQTCKLRDLLNN